MRLDWDYYFVLMAKIAAGRSGCNSRPTGAVIVKDNRIIATGYNGTVAGQPQCTDLGPCYCYRRSQNVDDRGENKYSECPSIHAEQNAINQMARFGGQGINDATIYCTLQPCIYCLKNIASVGIYRICYETAYTSDDMKRDRYWENKIEEYGIITKHITLPPEVKAEAFDLMCHETSKRRL